MIGAEAGLPGQNPGQEEGRQAMSRHGIPIGRIFGISIDLDYSWFLIVGLLVSVLIHELAHSLMARRNGNGVVGILSRDDILHYLSALRAIAA
jgi:hypothetical protein